MSRKAVLVFSIVLLALVGAAAAVARLDGWATTAARPRGSAGLTDAGDGQSQLVGTTMGTDWSVRLGRPLDAAAAAKLNAELQTLLDRLDGQMSTWKPASDLSRFNAHRGTDWYPVPADLAAVVAEAQVVSEASGGAFDVTVEPLVALWGFGPHAGAKDGEGVAATRQAVGRADGGGAAGPAAARATAHRVPSDDAVARAKVRVDYRKLECRASPPALRKLDPDVAVDLSAVCPGYSSDRMADLLDAAGVADYLVDLSSEIRARGRSPRGGPWRVGIQAPVPDTRRAIRGVALSDVALSPSGDYQNFFDEGGKRYCHEIDPRTGRPIDHALASVAVSHASAARADAWATALMVLGPDAGYDLAVRLKLAALFVTHDDGGFQTRATPAFEPLLLPEQP